MMSAWQRDLRRFDHLRHKDYVRMKRFDTYNLDKQVCPQTISPSRRSDVHVS